MFLLQIPTDTLGAAANQAGQGNPDAKQSFFEILLAGGWTMIPIAILFVLAIYIFVERYLNIQRSDKDTDAFMNTVRSHVLGGNLEQAKNYCMQENTPFARMILKGIKRLGSPLRDISSAIEAVGNLEIYRLEKRLGILATIAGAAPMLGFFGTVLGMIQAFMTIAQYDSNVTPAKLADPISTAMVTTAAGLAVGVIAYLGYNYLVNKVGSIIFKMESTSTDFIDLLSEPA